MSDNLPYMLESDLWPGLAKMQEEFTELLTILAKIQSNNGKTNYWGNRDLYSELHEELGDSLATIEFLVLRNGLDKKFILDRAKTKLEKYEEWSK